MFKKKRALPAVDPSAEFDAAYNAMNIVAKEMNMTPNMLVLSLAAGGMLGNPIFKDAAIQHLAYFGLFTQEALKIYSDAHSRFVYRIEQSVKLTLNDDAKRINSFLEAFLEYSEQIGAGAADIIRRSEQIMEPQQNTARRIYPKSEV